MANIDEFLIHTSTGPIRGNKKTSIFGKEYFNFQKIPYAQPPIGELRFRDPLPVKPWTEILDATAQGSECWNFNPSREFITGDEDCLHLHVYTNQINLSKPKPVMVYLHGGAFMWGSSTTDIYSPDYLIEKDIVLVTLNYRVGALGFLSINDPMCQAPGNAGLKDQSLAIKWINENIHHFGGDSKNITIFGESAGGCSVHYHMISDRSKNLFHKAILQSGCALNNWSVVANSTEMAKRLARQIGWNGQGTIIDAFKLLQSARPEDIIVAQQSIITPDELKRHILFAFGPSIEEYTIPNEIPMIGENSLEMIRTAWSNLNVPILIGGTSEDGLYLHRITMERPEALLEARLMEFLVPFNDIGLSVDSKECKLWGEKMKKFYFGDNGEPSKETLMNYIDLGTDKWFLHGLHRTILGRLNDENNAPTFVYRFNFDSPTFNHYKLMNCPGVKGACHGDDLSYLFKNALVKNPINKESDEYKTIIRMVDIWTKFAETGKPNEADVVKNLNWQPAKRQDGRKLLNISNELTVIDDPEKERMAFWDSMYQQNQLY